MNPFSYILKLNQLPDNLIDEICCLQDECKKLDDADFYIYLDKDDDFFDEIKYFHLFYTEHVLAGFLSFYIQDETSVCISGCVLPEYRGRHIFTRLFQSALEELSSYPELLKGIEFHLPDIDSDAFVPAIHFLNKNSLKLHHQEFLLNYDLTKRTEYYVPHDIYTEYDEHDNEFTIWLDNTYVGGCSIYFSEDFDHIHTSDSDSSIHGCATIYDYEILPEYRGKGYGKAGLMSILNDLQKLNFHHTILHVSGLNKKAHSMYISCGFTVQSSFSVYNSLCS